MSSLPSEYIKTAPSVANAITLFAGEWSTSLPGIATGAAVDLWRDPRADWVIAEMGGVCGKRVLELGPLEASHTWMLEQAGAAEIVAIESNPRAYLKCLIAKEALGLQRSKFLLGDFMAYLRETSEQFDLVFASGVLYHMLAPVELLTLIARVAPAAYLWTHYYDPQGLERTPGVLERFSAVLPASFGGFPHTLYRYHYGAALGWGGFCGGANETAYWLSRDDILGALKHVGLPVITVADAFDHVHHPNGAAFSLLARRADAE